MNDVQAIQLSRPQFELVTCPAKYPAFVGGFGCLRDDALVRSANGLRAISDLKAQDDVLSYSHSNQQFQLAPTSAAFPKGKDYLYRIVTTHGEFVASEHHHILSSAGKYQPVSSLRVGSFLSSCGLNLLGSNSELDRIWSREDDQHYWQTLLDCFRDCEDVSHLCDQRLLRLINNALICSQQQNDAHKLNLCAYERSRANQELLLKHNHLDQRGDHLSNLYDLRLNEHLASILEDQTLTLSFEHTLLECASSDLFLKKFLTHSQADAPRLALLDFHRSGGPFCRSASETTVVAVERQCRQEWFWDMHVAGNNNYVTADGAIHHNSGKTEALINRTLKFKFAYTKCNFAYYLPTYDLVRMIAFPRFEEKLEDMKVHANWISYKSVKSPRPSIKIHLYGEPAGEIIFRTMDNPSLIVGYEVADSAIDELDVMKRDDAEKAWRKIVARNRQKKPDGKKNTIAVGTTPEGFKFVYERWKKDPKPGYHLIPASTYSNQKNLPADYIAGLMADYPANLIAAYINGDFVNLTSGSVYPDFDRLLNNCETVLGIEDTNIHIGMDFNVTKMAAIVWKKVQRQLGQDKFVEEPHAVDELTGIFDTPAMITAIKNRFPNKIIHIYPDASGNARKSNNASESDIALLKAAGFHVHVNYANPAVKDRVLAMNVAILNGEDRRILRVNVSRCPTFTNGLEQQVYNTLGEPDKSSGLDHCLDAGGYFIAFTYPIKPTALKRVQLAGV